MRATRWGAWPPVATELVGAEPVAGQDLAGRRRARRWRRRTVPQRDAGGSFVAQHDHARGRDRQPGRRCRRRTAPPPWWRPFPTWARTQVAGRALCAADLADLHVHQRAARSAEQWLGDGPDRGGVGDLEGQLRRGETTRQRRLRRLIRADRGPRTGRRTDNRRRTDDGRRTHRSPGLRAPPTRPVPPRWTEEAGTTRAGWSNTLICTPSGEVWAKRRCSDGAAAGDTSMGRRWWWGSTRWWCRSPPERRR